MLLLDLFDPPTLTLKVERKTRLGCKESIWIKTLKAI
jgi:hypothetical protein